jgi:hypothetical protein
VVVGRPVQAVWAEQIFDDLRGLWVVIRLNARDGPTGLLFDASCVEVSGSQDGRKCMQISNGSFLASSVTVRNLSSLLEERVLSTTLVQRS